ncbi:MAG: peptidoglycan DD-metalloendopeptidase family protein, partial [Eubacterium sp.]|nr:peptidoglycan DD-metalloendopeptidase family protein [Eubacterium sp.]
MKLISILKKPISVLLAFCFILTLESFSYISAYSQDGNLSPEEEKAVIEQRIKEANSKLADLKEESASTQEHLNTLNDKIGYLEQEMSLINDEVDENKTTVEDLQLKCEENEKAIRAAENDIKELTAKLDETTAQFTENYDAYCQRLRAMYVSGETSIFAFLLTSSDISQFLTRLEMIRRVSKHDSELLEAIDSEMESIKKSKKELSEKEQELTSQRTELLQTKENLEASITALNSKQEELDTKKVNLSVERANANVLLTKLSNETGYYTEYLEDNKESLEEIDRALAAAAEKYKDTVVTTTTTTTTTTTAPAGSNNGSSQTTTVATTSQSSSNHIKFTFPVPSQTIITTGMYDYAGHSGADFKCNMGDSIVAAESGTVIISADLTNEDGSYRSYGRYIVIMHDKTTASGDMVYTLYAHNSVRLVSEGQHVEKGQVIAKAGSTGNSSGPHCHFEVR